MNNLYNGSNNYVFDINKFRLTLAKLRKDHDMTQFELADKLNLTRQAISRYENGDSFPDIATLLLICKIFSVSIDYLIGIKTTGEQQIINKLVEGKDFREKNYNLMDDLINLAPILKPSEIDKMVMGFKNEGINIEIIVKLISYLNDKSLYHLLMNADFSSPSREVLEFLFPYLDDDSKWVIFYKILEGKIDYHFLEEFIPACDWLPLSLIEAAVVEGVMDYDALRIMREGSRRRYIKNSEKIYRF